MQHKLFSDFVELAEFFHVVGTLLLDVLAGDVGIVSVEICGQHEADHCSLPQYGPAPLLHIKSHRCHHVMNSSSPLEHLEPVIDMGDDAAKEIANNNQASELNVQLLMNERLLT